MMDDTEKENDWNQSTLIISGRLSSFKFFGWKEVEIIEVKLQLVI